MSEELKTILFRANPTMVKMLEKIRIEKGQFGSNADVIRHAIAGLYDKYFKEYGKDTIGSEGSTSIKMPKMTKEQKEEQKQHDICMALNGTIKDTNGNKTCHYTIYEKVNPKLVNKFEQGLPLSMLSPDTIARQYSPNREEVEQTLEQNQ